MPKHYSRKFWIIYWLVSLIFLASFWALLQFRNRPLKTTESVINYLPLDFSQKTQLKSVAYLADYFRRHDNQERTFMLLFQNNMELRPGGGYIGSFGILKIKNGKIEELQTHDISNFDGRIPSNIKPPYPMEQILHINAWKLRDSNWSPDFSENAKKAVYFYHLGKGEERFSGVIAINTNVLKSFLQVIGPVKIKGYPGVYKSDNATLNLEYQVEKGYVQQGIQVGDRKSVMRLLAKIILKKLFLLSNSQKFELAKLILANLNAKDIQLYFFNPTLENKIKLSGWAGTVNKNWKKDYLMIVDANLGSFKSDYYIKRSFSYTIDLSHNLPQAFLKITYNHTGKVKDWMTKNYLTYVRVYVPAKSWLTNSKGLENIQYGDDLGKKYFGSLVNVSLGQTKTVELKYNLPKNFKSSDYDLLIQKESGVKNIPGKITIIKKNNSSKKYNITLLNEWMLSKQK